MIIAVRIGGQAYAQTDCDSPFCYCTGLVRAAHERKRTVDQPDKIQNLGKVRTKLLSSGWSTVGKKVYCPECTKARSKSDPIPEQETPEMSTVDVKKVIPAKLSMVQDIRHPTVEQDQQIMDMLLASYDRKEKRYSGTDTDKTVADAIGGGCMPGWVAEVRERFFGPDGSNDEMILLRDQLASTLQHLVEEEKVLSDLIQQATKSRSSVSSLTTAVLNLEKRLEAIKASVGPKAARL